MLAHRFASWRTDPLGYVELQGFLFAVASAPAMVVPSDWLPVVLGREGPAFEDLDQANTILGALMMLPCSTGHPPSRRERLP